ncbi:D-alanyl-D-alanine carboxypeptidase family protein [Anaerocolumna aminovalerica]|uniref:D-alanyl-D-alanine carboxypeptidase family protein n=1 Tax=Anaerocolumna aminovalerica TaxID=1527 RepID=UPI00209E8D75|nr:D-alanyl-D-alanine carboxypeptidase family protein [Anaerocolumna aminovalerica]
MKKKILPIVVTMFILYFASFTHYKALGNKLDQEYKNIQNQVKAEEVRIKGIDDKNITVKDSKDTVPESTPVEYPNMKLHAIGSALMDADSGRVLYEKKGNDPLPMASTTKIMTCIVALEKGNLEDVVTVSKYASTRPAVKLGIREGEQYILKDLLYSLMLESHNDVAVAIAEHIGGSVQGFAKMMNDKAKEIGCKNTHFVTPNGLDANGHYTTAVELSKIASYAIKNEQFIKITNEPIWNFSEVKTGRKFAVSNKDRFLYIFEGAIGVKTGFTGKAGYCFVGAVKRNNKTLVSAVLGSGWPPNKSYKWSDTTKLMNYGLDNFDYKTIFEGTDDFQTIMVENGIESTTDTYVEGDLGLLVSKSDKIDYTYDMPEVVKAPIYKGSAVGYINIWINGEIYTKFPIRVSKTVAERDFNYCLDQIMKMYKLK